ncbi:cytochrome P450 [Nocardiopsis kunsanensis]|uniref:cytochrome P450 n=1 Tax=Nocardiopsis kunsanensis TaxID=141693 RepID=UPI0003674237|nr:cytochrome P450 [Nocardiopsis kunsanensis]
MIQTDPSILFMDPPEHQRVRRLLARAFTSKHIEWMRPRIERMVTGLLDGMVEHGHPADDMIGVLAAALDDEDFSEDELAVFGVTLLLAGDETASNQIANFTFTLLTHPDQLALLRAEPELLPGAVEELLRFVPLGTGTGYPFIATRDVEFPGATLREGEAITVHTGAANRDPQLCDDPDELDLRRPPGKHFAFGHGAHYCLGAELARIELQVALRELLRRFPGLELAVPADKVEFRDDRLARGPATLPVRW